jgi:hypothetical protein
MRGSSGAIFSHCRSEMSFWRAIESPLSEGNSSPSTYATL